MVNAKLADATAYWPRVSSMAKRQPVESRGDGRGGTFIPESGESLPEGFGLLQRNHNMCVVYRLHTCKLQCPSSGNVAMTGSTAVHQKPNEGLSSSGSCSDSFTGSSPHNAPWGCTWAGFCYICEWLQRHTQIRKPDPIVTRNTAEFEALGRRRIVGAFEDDIRWRRHAAAGG